MLKRDAVPEGLAAFFAAHPRLALAFSGGTDSAYLMYAAMAYGCDVKAWYARSAFQPEFEYRDALRLAAHLGAPMAALPEKVVDEESWRAAIREWVDDFLFMTLPTEPAQMLCAALFRHEVTHPTKFHEEFLNDFGKPIYDALRSLLARAISDETRLDLWTTSVWAQVSVYALADKTWHASFRPKGVGVRDWAERVRDHICETLFASVSFPENPRK